MKDVLIVVSAAALVSVTVAVVALKHNDQVQNSISPENDYVSCSEVCQKKLFDSCNKVKGSLDNCEANCERWTPGMKACVKSASQCAELDLDFTRSKEDLFREDHDPALEEKNKISKKSSCTIVDDDYSEIEKKEPKKELKYSCSSACYKYKQCAGYGQDITEKDKNDAYDFCFEECQNWSQKTLDCMGRVAIYSPADCAPLTMCALGEYKDIKPGER